MRIRLFILQIFYAIGSYAIIAYPNWIYVSTPNGSLVHIMLKGDEFCKWAVTEDGYTLLPDSIGWVYAKEDANGFAIASSFTLYNNTSQNDSLNSFLSKTSKGIPLQASQFSLKKSSQTIRSTDFSPKIGDRKILVILMSFKDISFKKLQTDFNALFNQKGYLEDGAKGSVYDFFSQVSYGQLNLKCDILGPYTSAHEMSYYGRNTINGNDANPQALFMEAIEAASKKIRFSDYDANKDGYVDNVHIIFAGYGEEAGAISTAIWSHEATFHQAVEIQKMKINCYSCAPELRENKGNGISRIGPHCHEIGHALGAMDYYDVDYSNGGEYQGTGKWDIMASGSWNNNGITPADFNPYVKIHNFGWLNAKALVSSMHTRILPSNYNNDQIYRISTPVPEEYYLLENRSRQGFGASIPGEGLLIYHIHKDLESSGNRINASYPQKCFIVCASSKYAIPTTIPSSFGEINSSGCPFPGSSGNHSFSDISIPSSLCWDKTESKINLSDITLHIDSSISFFCETRPTDDEQELLFQEGFETIIPVVNQSQDTIKWNVYQYSENISQINDGLTPKPFEGKKYLHMKKAIDDLSPEKNISSVEINPFPLDPEHNYVLTLQYQNRAVKDQNGSITIQYRTNDNAEWKDIIRLDTPSSSWSKKEIDLPEPSARYQLSFTGSLNTGGLFLDDLQILKRSNPLAITVTSPSEQNTTAPFYMEKNELKIKADLPTMISWYDLSGRFCGNIPISIGVNTLSMSQGGYIAVYKGKSYKVIIP